MTHHIKVGDVGVDDDGAVHEVIADLHHAGSRYLMIVDHEFYENPQLIPDGAAHLYGFHPPAPPKPKPWWAVKELARRMRG